jgi:L-asparaginase II
MHVEPTAVCLERCGLSVSNLECRCHAPSHGPTSDDLVRMGTPFHAAHNNCSGKPAAMLVPAKHLGDSATGYYVIPIQCSSGCWVTWSRCAA